MLGVGGAGGFGFFFLLEPRPEAVPTRLRWDFFFLVFRDSELLVPAEEGTKARKRGGDQAVAGWGHPSRGAQLQHLPRPHP